MNMLNNTSSLKRSAPGSFPTEFNDLDQADLVKTCQKVMTTFQDNTQLIPNTHALPTTRINTKTPILAYLPKSLTFEIHLMWTLAQALLDTQSKQWLTRLVEPGLQAALDRIKRQTDDPWAEVFTYLCFGQLDRASAKVKSMNAYVVKMLIDLVALKPMQTVIGNQIAGYKAVRAWQSMTRYQQRVWYVLAGRLGWVDEGYVVVEDQTWQCTLCMYVYYAEDQLRDYQDTVQRRKKTGFNDEFTFKRTEAPDEECQWYQLLDWWYGGGDDSVMAEWPLELTWLLTFYRPDRFKDDSCALAWVDRLEKLELPEMAIYACLFMKHNTETQLSQLLQSYEWEKEDMLLHSFYIPRERVLYGKALNAHDEWNFEAEYGYFLEGSFEEEAKKTLFNFVLPKLYRANDDACLKSSLDYINQYPHQEDIEIKVIKDIYSMLLTKEGDKEEVLSGFDHLDVSSKRSFNFFKLIPPLLDAFKNI
ncbi:hypothetical protein K501DRAFT_328958 [Backusella circina FSU 941]|nr:hypothetical protein K501DRAFT_328958 [Backusella circina FSU 941]